MNEKQSDFPDIPERLPAKLTDAQCAAVLGFKPHDIPVLVGARLLKPLGNPPSRSTRFFCTFEILELAADRNWLSKATNAVYQHWSRKNHSDEAQVESAQAA